MTVLSYSTAKLQKNFEIFSKNTRFGPNFQQKLGKTRKNSETPFLMLYLCRCKQEVATASKGCGSA